jgi:hypothetical protein
MTRVSARHIPAIALLFSALALAIFGSVARIRVSYLAVGVLGILLFAAYAWKRSRLAEAGMGTVLLVGFIFLAGALFGLIQSLVEGWQWIDLLSLVLPIALGAYLVWFAVRSRSANPG